MPITLIFSDTHSNLSALRTALKWVEDTGQTVDRYISLGDQIGYGPHPQETLDLLATIPNLHMLQGNHDAALTNPWLLSQWNPRAAGAIKWTKQALRDYTALLDLRPELREGDVMYTHGDFVRPGEFDYLYRSDELQINFRCTDFRVGFYGHTHLPVGFRVREGEGLLRPEVLHAAGWCRPQWQHLQISRYEDWVQLEEGYRYIFNPGSMGQPRDRDPRLSFMLYDTGLDRVKWVRLDYDIEATAGAILAMPPVLEGEVGLSPSLGHRLYKGE